MLLDICLTWKQQATCGTPDLIYSSHHQRTLPHHHHPRLCVDHIYSTSRMPLASSSFLRVSSHWVNCLDSRNIWNAEVRGQWTELCSWQFGQFQQSQKLYPLTEQ